MFVLHLHQTQCLLVENHQQNKPNTPTLEDHTLDVRTFEWKAETKSLAEAPAAAF